MFSLEIGQQEELNESTVLAETMIEVQAAAAAADPPEPAARAAPGADPAPGRPSEPVRGGQPGEHSGPQAAVVLVVDHSESMGHRPARLPAAKAATAAAIDAIRDGALFAVVAGNYDAAQLYPREGGLASADPATRAAAKLRLTTLDAVRGTRIGRWLLLARDLLEPYPRAVRHVVLFTDGKNEHEAARELGQALAACRGRFRCDVRGIGDDWDRGELTRIAEELNGSADSVPDAADLEPELRALMVKAMGAVVPELTLRIRLSKGVRIEYVKQFFPSQLDLTAYGAPVPGAAAAFDYSTGPWGEELRQYMLCLRTEPQIRTAGVKSTLARVELLAQAPGAARPEPLDGGRFVARTWTREPNQPTDFVEHLTRHGELADVIHDGVRAWRNGDRAGARDAWRRAAYLARQVDNQLLLERLGRVVDLGSGAAAELKDGIVEAQLGYLEMGTSYPTVYTDAQPAAPSFARHSAEPSGPDRQCPDCQRILPPNAMFCDRCARALDAPAAATRPEGAPE
jgi:von Willebrand factor type A domain